MSLNKVMLIGNVGRDPNVRYLEGNNPGAGQGRKVATFTLATSERYRDRSGETRENTEWHNIVAWRNSADVAEKFIRKGTQVYIEGKLRTRSWTDQGGNKRFTTEVAVDSLQLLGKRDATSPVPPLAPPTPSTPSTVSGTGYQPQQPTYQQPSYQQPAYQQPKPAAQEPMDIMDDNNPTDDLPF